MMLKREHCQFRDAVFNIHCCCGTYSNVGVKPQLSLKANYYLKTHTSTLIPELWLVTERMKSLIEAAPVTFLHWVPGEGAGSRSTLSIMFEKEPVEMGVPDVSSSRGCFPYPAWPGITLKSGMTHAAKHIRAAYPVLIISGYSNMFPPG